MQKILFSDASEDFMKNTMCICMDDLKDKISKNAPNYIEFFQDLIEYLVTIHSLSAKNADEINQAVCDFFLKYNIKEPSMAYLIGDSIRHLFIHFYNGGILEAFQYREPEVYYPKMSIRVNLGSRIDIDSLDEEIEIYRGMSKDEYIEMNFGQAWTLDFNIAKQFAFEHYKNSAIYKDTIRCIAKTRICRDNIYYYSNNQRESEIIIDERKIKVDSMEIMEEKMI